MPRILDYSLKDLGNRREILNLENRVENLESSTLIRYEVEFKVADSDGTTVTATTGTRLYDAVGMTALATQSDSADVQNDFDNAPIYKNIQTAEIDKNGNVVHWIDEDEFDFNSEYDKMTYLPHMYCMRRQVTKSDGVYMRYGISNQKVDKYYKEFNEKWLARYEGSLDAQSRLCSLSGKIPTYNRNIKQFESYAKANGEVYTLRDIWTNFQLQCLYLVEYANTNSQATLGNGICTWVGDGLKALIAENEVNRIVIATNATAKARLYVGKCITIGTAAWNGSICQDRKVTAVEEYNDGTITGMAIYFDGEPINIAIGNVLWGSAQTTGQCNDLKMRSGSLKNDGEHSVIYRGIENPFGNMWEFLVGINCKAGNETYICENPEKYQVDKYTDDYKLLGYTKGITNGWVKRLGYDPDYPEIALPIEVGASANTGLCDYYYNENHAYNRIALVGGCFNVGANCGLFCWAFNHASSVTNWHFGGRLLKYH